MLKNMSVKILSSDRSVKTLLLAGIIALAYTCVLFVIYYDVGFDTSHSKSFKIYHKTDQPLLHSNVTKKIFFWNTMFGDPTFYFGKGDIFRDCSVDSRDCVAMHDRSSINVEDFDAVLFHGSELNPNDLPKTRRLHQYYVFANLESPANHPIRFAVFNYDFFNLTMTYRLDSDVIWPYAEVRRFDDNNFVAPRLRTVWDIRDENQIDVRNTSSGIIERKWDVSEMTKIRMKKKKAAAWFVSNCEGKSGRKEYVNKLAMYIDVDIYGLCGKKGCPRNRDCFREVIEPEYYFYLSFENTMCQDYVTEKLYKALQYNVVPVVYGGANYSLFAPPRSYINALDFDSPQQLAEYLRSLIANPSEYDKYFVWKKSYAIVDSFHHTICRLCQYLHENDRTKIYTPLSDWYERDKCPLQEILKNVPYMTKKHLKYE